MDSTRYDEALLKILQAEGKIIPFLDVLFGFLYRCTDFYHEHKQPSAVGFPPGVAEQLTLTAFRKWRHQHCRLTDPATAPPAVAEEEVMTSQEPMSRDRRRAPTVERQSPADSGEPGHETESTSKPSGPSTSDTHNGAARECYSWSQTIGDVTVRVPVPETARRAKQVSVELASERVAVRLAGGETLVDGQLHRPIQAVESTWSLLPGEAVQLSLEKGRECWWASLLDSEPQIDLRGIDAVKPYEDLSQEEQMKIAELRAREETKRAPVPPAATPVSVAAAPGTSNKDVSALLREAWDAEGSPFRGQPYDPAAVQIVPQGGGLVPDSPADSRES